ncbi:TPA: hypothetical protein MEA72_004551 [Klebsiella aerogenes]|nr:hypothetical protein [Klebsiella aerogenes]
MLLLAGGAVLMSLPWWWTTSPYQQTALYRLTGLWSLVLLVAILRQVPLHSIARRRLYALVALAGVFQSILAFWQLIWPGAAGRLMGFNLSLTGGRPVGNLLQANLLGSFLATAFLCSLWLAFSSRRPGSRALALAGVFWLAAGIMASLSRTALIAALPAAAILLCLVAGQRTARLLAVGLILGGLLAGQGVLALRPAVLSHPSGDARPVTTTARLQHDRLHSGIERQALIKGAVAMITRAPLAGNGLGSFERQFPDALASIGVNNPFTVTVSHPHNEILYVWSEGGIVAALGLLLWLGVWGSPLLRRRRRVASGWLLTVPLVVHCMTEMPFYLSAIHAVLLAILFRLALPAGGAPTLPARPLRYLCVAGLILLCLSGGAFMATGIQSATRLQEAERFRLMDPTPLEYVSNPLAQPDRLLFDQAVNHLMMFNLLQDPSLTDLFSRQASYWLMLHNDANLTATLMRLAQRRGDVAQTQHWRRRGCLSFRQDERFQCQSFLLLPESNHE